jgi:hypothetical protein
MDVTTNEEWKRKQELRLRWNGARTSCPLEREARTLGRSPERLNLLRTLADKGVRDPKGLGRQLGIRDKRPYSGSRSNQFELKRWLLCFAD